MSTEVEICNRAIADCMSQETIASFTENSSVALACRMFYAVCRDELLTDYQWSFATKRVLLAKVGDELVTNWGFCYAYPTDCLDIQYLVAPGQRRPAADSAIPYEVGNYNDQLCIFSDGEELEICYTARITNTFLFPISFTTALEFLVASRICRPIGKADLAVQLEQTAIAMAIKAAGRSMNEANPGPEPDGELVRGRA